LDSEVRAVIAFLRWRFLIFTVVDERSVVNFIRHAMRKRKSGRPKSKATFESGPEAQAKFMLGMKALLAAKQPKKRTKLSGGN